MIYKRTLRRTDKEVFAIMNRYIWVISMTSAAVISIILISIQEINNALPVSLIFLLFSLLSGIITALLKKKHSGYSSEKRTPGSHKNTVGHSTPVEVRVSRFTSVPSPDTGMTSQRLPVAAGPWICPGCETEHPAGTEICPVCGAARPNYSGRAF